jgi:hypothetical protein
MMRVKLVKYNWNQIGSTKEISEVSEDFIKFEVGIDGVIFIEETLFREEVELCSYIIHTESGIKHQIFNPDFVEYFTREERNVNRTRRLFCEKINI